MAMEASIAHWTRQTKFLRGHNVRETTNATEQKSRAPWYTEAISYNNRGTHTLLTSENSQTLRSTYYENPAKTLYIWVVPQSDLKFSKSQGHTIVCSTDGENIMIATNFSKESK